MIENNALVIAEKLDVSVVFTADGLQGILQDIESQAMAHVPDIETDQGRKDIASMAYKVTRSKTLIDNLGKDVASDWKKKAKVIDGYRKTARDFLDELKDKVRQPLTDWEAEQARIKEEEDRKEREKIEKRIQSLAQYRVILPYQDVCVMTDEEFDTVLFDAKEEWKAEQERQAEAEAIRKAEEERLEKQRQEQEAEAARLKKQADEIAAQQKAIQAEKDRIEAEKRSEQEALKPDKEKLLTWVKFFDTPENNPTPELKETEAISLLDTIIVDLTLLLENAIGEIEDL